MESKPFSVIGIAGASGVGKSTLALGLKALYPDLIEVVHFDDFQRSNDAIIHRLGSLANWDHPEVTDFEQAASAISSLKHGKRITVQVKNEFDNPDFMQKNIYVRFPRVIEPSPIVIVEGHYVLYHPVVREQLDMSVFLTGDLGTSTTRRTKSTDDAYNAEYLLPMYAEYIAPTETYADHVINVDALDRAQVQTVVADIICRRFIEPS